MSSLLLQDKNNSLSESHQEIVNMIIQSGNLLTCVVNDVLDYARLETGNVDIHEQPTPLRTILKAVVQAMQIKCQFRGQRINSSGINYACLPENVTTDSNRLQQILYNLLENAIKFSKDGGEIDFSVQVCNDVGSSSECHIQYTIKDYGIGISSENHEKIFKPFEQGGAGIQKIYGGSGLGLSITRKLVERLNGSLTLDSVFGEWTEVVVILPHELPDRNHTNPSEVCLCATDVHPIYRSLESSTRANEEPSSIVQKPQPHTHLEEKKSSLRVLVVDDIVINQKILRSILKRLGLVNIDIASDGAQAVSIEKMYKYDLILMDMKVVGQTFILFLSFSIQISAHIYFYFSKNFPTFFISLRCL